jgi:hypothetical protein
MVTKKNVRGKKPLRKSPSSSRLSISRRGASKPSLDNAKLLLEVIRLMEKALATMDRAERLVKENYLHRGGVTRATHPPFVEWIINQGGYEGKK